MSDTRKNKGTPKGTSRRVPKSGKSIIETLSEREARAARAPTEERIRPIKDYENLYAASTSGKIYRIKSNGDLVALKPDTAPNGYQTVGLSKNNKCHSYLVHNLIARTFYGERPKETPYIRHLDGDKTNNALDNLCYGTWLDNYYDTYLIGERRSKNGFTILEVIAIREEAKKGTTVHKLSKDYGRSEATIRNVISGRTYGWVPTDEESIARIIAEVARAKG